MNAPLTIGLAVVAIISIAIIAVPYIGGSPLTISHPISFGTIKSGNTTVPAKTYNDTMTFTAGDGIVLSLNPLTNTLIVNATQQSFNFTNNNGTITDASNTGSGAGIFRATVGSILEFKSLDGQNGVIINVSSDHLTFDLNNIPKSRVSLTGNWVKAELPNDVVYTNDTQILKNKTINGSKNTITNIPWSGLNKTGSILNDIGDVNSDTCQNGQLLKWSTLSDTWDCYDDNNSGISSAITSINSANGPAITIQGSNGNATISTLGNTITVNIGNKVVTLDGVQSLSNKNIDSDSNTITNIDDGDIKSGANIAKSKISASGTFPWSEISKTSSLIGDLSDVASGCINGQYLTYQFSNSTWICTTNTSLDTNTAQIGNVGHGESLFANRENSTKNNLKGIIAGNNFITVNSNGTDVFIFGNSDGVQSINFDSAISQTLLGAVGNLTITNNGGGSHTFNIGSDVVMTNGQTQTITKGLTINSLTLGGNGDAANNKITNLGTPTLSTDAARVNTLQTKSLVTSTCQDGSPLKYQLSNSTWICGTDNSGSGITNLVSLSGGTARLLNYNSTITGIFKSLTQGTGITITNGTTTLTITNSGVTSIGGTSNNVTMSSSTGAVTANLGSNVVVTGGSDQTFTKNLFFGTLATIFGSDPADSGSIRFSNGQLIGWESSPAGTDGTITFNSGETFVITPTTNELYSFNATNFDMSTNKISGSMGCNNGAILEFNSVTGVWDCGIDDTGVGGGFTKINNVGSGAIKLIQTNSSNTANIKSLTTIRGITLTNGTTSGQIDTNFKVNSKSSAIRQFLTSFNNATSDGNFGVTTFGANTFTCTAGQFVSSYDNATGVYTCSTPSGPTILGADVTCTQTASYCTVFTVPLTSSSGNMIDFNLVADTNTAGVALQFRGRTDDAQATGFCTIIAQSTATAQTVDTLAVGTAPTDDGNSAWLAGANVAQPESIKCSVEADASTPQNLILEVQMELAGTGTIQKGSNYIKTP